jgi:hypothetical protein
MPNDWRLVLPSFAVLYPLSNLESSVYSRPPIMLESTDPLQQTLTGQVAQTWTTDHTHRPTTERRVCVISQAFRDMRGIWLDDILVSEVDNVQENSAGSLTPTTMHVYLGRMRGRAQKKLTNITQWGLSIMYSPNGESAKLRIANHDSTVQRDIRWHRSRRAGSD